MKVFTIAIQRGGAGKTTTTLNLGASLKAMGKRVLFIDLDAQRSLSLSMGIRNGDNSSFELLNNECDIEEAIQESPYGDIIPASYSLIASDKVITETGKEYRLKEALERVSSNYDYVVIDTPPGLGILTINALTCADYVIIPAQAELYSLEGLALLNQSITTVKKYTNPNLKLGGILITRYNARTNFSKEVFSKMEEYASMIGTFVYKQPIRECIAIKEAQACLNSIFDYAPKSNASEDYRAFTEELLSYIGG